MQSDGVSVYQVIRGTFILLVSIGVWGWVLYRCLRRSEDPPLLIVKWIVTALVVGAMVWLIKPFSNAPMDWADVMATLIGGLVLAIIWRHNIASVIAKPFGNLYDGGDVEIEPQAYYSIAEGKRNKGQYLEAVAEIRKQLTRFPSDFIGQMMLAEIQVKNLNDLPGAEITIHRFVEQKGHAPRNIALALNSLADWHLKYALDPESARQDLEKLVAMLPGSEFALAAEHRIGHMANREHLMESHDRHRFVVHEGPTNLGLVASAASLIPEEIAPDAQAELLVKHLEEHPMDTEARERLAKIYSSHYKRLDLAGDQLEQIIEVPNQPAKNIIRWLNILADLQIQQGVDYETVRETLERIIHRYPNNPAATVAMNRIDLLKLEFKGKEKGQAVKLGTYEQYLGLKQGLPRQL